MIRNEKKVKNDAKASPKPPVRILNIITLGDSGVGKTSIIKR